jgi:hypothetical protein
MLRTCVLTVLGEQPSRDQVLGDHALATGELRDEPLRVGVASIACAWGEGLSVAG